MYRSVYGLPYSSPDNSSLHTNLSHILRGPPPSSSQIRKAGAEAISALDSIGVKGCFVGGMACKLFGGTRDPNDVDILCLDCTLNQEALKRSLVSHNPNFYLVAARNPLATYKVLWYRLTDTDSRVKVDLLLPGVLNIPSIPSSSITRSNRYKLPCAPLSLVFLLKLQAWDHHRQAKESWYNKKQFTDVKDIEELLPIICDKGIRPCSNGFLPQDFTVESAMRAGVYATHYPSTRKYWETLGLVKPKKTPTDPSQQSRALMIERVIRQSTAMNL